MEGKALFSTRHGMSECMTRDRAAASQRLVLVNVRRLSLSFEGLGLRLRADFYVRPYVRRTVHVLGRIGFVPHAREGKAGYRVDIFVCGVLMNGGPNEQMDG